MAKVYNFNSMRPAIVAAHNQGNRKAINKDIVDGAGIDNAHFIQWQADVKALQDTVWDYVQKKKNARFDSSIDEGVLYAARNRIFPKWKEILAVGEKDSKAKELHVDEADVEDLIGFAWDFMATTKGTAEVKTTDQIFRKKVESLLGCAIAKNAVLDDNDRDTLSQFYAAQRSIQKAIDTKAELELSMKNFTNMKADVPETEKQFLTYIDKQIKALKEQIAAVDEQKATAEANEKKYAKDAKAIELKIKAAK